VTWNICEMLIYREDKNHRFVKNNLMITNKSFEVSKNRLNSENTYYHKDQNLLSS
jgi:hypothetical protein